MRDSVTHCHNVLQEQIDAIVYLSDLEVEDESLRTVIRKHAEALKAAVAEDLID